LVFGHFVLVKDEDFRNFVEFLGIDELQKLVKALTIKRESQSPTHFISALDLLPYSI
jgi:hypothetical protein